MVNYHRSLDATFAALADPTRRAILARLARGDTPVTDLAAPFAMSLPAVSKHLNVLERAGLIRRHRDGRIRRCRLRAEPMRQAAGWITRYRRFWEGQFDQLARYLDEIRLEDSPWPPMPGLPPTPSASAAPSTRRASASSARGRRRRR